jgi:uncharacterized protein
MSYAADSSASIDLLTVSEQNNTGKGGVAKLTLVVKHGSGRIFIDSFPLSKLDTQITMRFASEVACELLDKDCSNYDFFYTITATSSVVGGPSAGAAATVLTVAVLDGQTLRNDVIMTGTINSGNLIGPVAGISAKTRAAQDKGYNIVIIPKWDNVNNTPDENLTIQIVRSSKLEEALYYFTGKNYSKSNIDIKDGTIAKEYYSMMEEVTLDLCTKYSIDKINFPNLEDYGYTIVSEYDSESESYNNSRNYSDNNITTDNFELAKNAISQGSYYSAASFCFGGNAKITTKIYEGYDNEQLKLEYAKLLTDISNLENDLDTKYSNPTTISALESYMIVSERLYDSKKIISRMDLNNISAERLAYAKERYNTANVWLKFYNLPGQEFVMDENLLKIVCSKKLSEAEERVNYMELYYPDKSVREDLASAYEYYYGGNYALCIFTSSKVKADSNVVLSAIFISSNDTGKLLDEKLLAASSVMSEQSKNGIFPIIGYSYFEYAKTLGEADAYSGLLYAEYALELSNIEMYFKKKSFLNLDKGFNFGLLFIFILGIILGILLSAIFVLIKLNKPRKLSVDKNKVSNNKSSIVKKKK